MRTPQLLSKLLRLSAGGLVWSQATYSTPCPLLGPEYPPPKDLASSSSILQVKNDLTQAITGAFDGGEFGQLDNSTSFSFEVYSLLDEQPIHNQHYTSPSLSNTDIGVNQVNSDTVYRIGSVSKLLTTYIYLINVGFANWNDPITKYIPELKTFTQNHSGSTNSIDFPNFDHISIGALASHLSGLSRDAAPGPASDAALAAIDLPQVPPAPGKYCGAPNIEQFPCTRDDFFANYLSEHPVALPFYTPIYGNAPFYLLQLALENMASPPLSELFNTTFVTPLGLNSTYYNQPSTNTSAVIPGNNSVAWWSVDLHYDIAAGGYYSSLNDLRAIGRSILSFSLLPSHFSRRWLKPVTFTSNPNQSVGAPWEIMRAPIPRTSFMYTKSGDLPRYSCMFALLPDYNVGFNILAAGDAATSQTRVLADMISSAFVPAIEAEAKAQVTQNYADTYTDTTANSSMTISVTAPNPSLVVQVWTYEGQDVLALLTRLMSLGPTQQKVAINLYPSGLSNQNSTIESWRAVFEIFPQRYDSGPFSTNYQTWNGPDKLVYGGIAFDEFLFSIDGDGKAVSVEPRVLRLSMAKSEASRTKMVRKCVRASSVRSCRALVGESKIGM